MNDRTRPPRFRFQFLPRELQTAVAARLPRWDVASLSGASRGMRATMSNHLDSLQPSRRYIGEIYGRLERMMPTAVRAADMMVSGSWAMSSVARLNPPFTVAGINGLFGLPWMGVPDSPYLLAEYFEPRLMYSYHIKIHTPYRHRKWMIEIVFGKAFLPSSNYYIYIGMMGQLTSEKFVNIYVRKDNHYHDHTPDLRRRVALTELFARVFRRMGFRVSTATPNWATTSAPFQHPDPIGVIGPELLQQS